MSKVKIIFLSIYLLLGLFQKTALADGLNSASITTDTLQAVPHCQQLKVIGACVWFSPTGGYSTTPLVEHYSPDVVVSVFNKPGENPWTELNASIDVAGAATEQQIVSQLSGGDDAGSGQHSASQAIEQNVFFKQADIAGNPALPAFDVNPLLLPSTATPLIPYYQSMLDAAMWRGFPNFLPAAAEETYSLVAALTRYVGIGLINWGSVYPHEGKVLTSNDAKAAAVIAQRAGDLITATRLIPGHIYVPLSNDCGQHCQAAPIHESSSSTLFQMIYPTVSNTCEYFGKTASYGEAAEQQTQGAYAWVVWRYYRGCRDGDGKFVQEIHF